MWDRIFPLEREQQGILTVIGTVIAELIVYFTILMPFVRRRLEEAPPEVFRDSYFVAMWAITAFSFVSMGIIMRVHNNSEYGLGILKGCLYVYIYGVVVVIALAWIGTWIFIKINA